MTSPVTIADVFTNILTESSSLHYRDIIILIISNLYHLPHYCEDIWMSIHFGRNETFSIWCLANPS